MQTLPYAVVTNKNMLHVYELYYDAFEKLRKVREVVTTEDNEQYCKIIRGTLREHLTVLPRLTMGILECRDLLQPTEIDKFMHTLLKSRISRRVIAEQHLALTEMFNAPWHFPDAKADIDSNADFIGEVFLRCNAREVVQSCWDRVVALAKIAYGAECALPDLMLEGNLEATFPYILTHLQYIIAELLRNALQAVVEVQQAPHLKPPPIQVLVCEASQHVIIRISDQGGGIPTEVMPRLWSFSKGARSQTHLENLSQVPKMAATMQEVKEPCLEPLDEVHGKPNANQDASLSSLTTRPPNLRLGMGLPTSRAYAEYWAGSLELHSLDGYGVDAFLQISKLGNKNEQLTTRASIHNFMHTKKTPVREEIAVMVLIGPPPKPTGKSSVLRKPMRNISNGQRAHLPSSPGPESTSAKETLLRSYKSEQTMPSKEFVTTPQKPLRRRETGASAFPSSTRRNDHKLSLGESPSSEPRLWVHHFPAASSRVVSGNLSTQTPVNSTFRLAERDWKEKLEDRTPSHLNSTPLPKVVKANPMAHSLEHSAQHTTKLTTRWQNSAIVPPENVEMKKPKAPETDPLSESQMGPHCLQSMGHLIISGMSCDIQRAEDFCMPITQCYTKERTLDSHVAATPIVRRGPVQHISSTTIWRDLNPSMVERLYFIHQCVIGSLETVIKTRMQYLSDLVHEGPTRYASSLDGALARVSEHQLIIDCQQFTDTVIQTLHGQFSNQDVKMTPSGLLAVYLASTDFFYRTLNEGEMAIDITITSNKANYSAKPRIQTSWVADHITFNGFNTKPAPGEELRIMPQFQCYSPFLSKDRQMCIRSTQNTSWLSWDSKSKCFTGRVPALEKLQEEHGEHKGSISEHKSYPMEFEIETVMLVRAGDASKNENYPGFERTIYTRIRLDVTQPKIGSNLTLHRLPVEDWPTIKAAAGFEVDKLYPATIDKCLDMLYPRPFQFIYNAVIDKFAPRHPLGPKPRFIFEQLSDRHEKLSEKLTQMAQKHTELADALRAAKSSQWPSTSGWQSQESPRWELQMPRTRDLKIDNPLGDFLCCLDISFKNELLWGDGAQCEGTIGKPKDEDSTMNFKTSPQFFAGYQSDDIVPESEASDLDSIASSDTSTRKPAKSSPSPVRQPAQSARLPKSVTARASHVKGLLTPRELSDEDAKILHSRCQSIVQASYQDISDDDMLNPCYSSAFASDALKQEEWPLERGTKSMVSALKVVAPPMVDYSVTLNDQVFESYSEREESEHESDVESGEAYRDDPYGNELAKEFSKYAERFHPHLRQPKMASLQEDLACGAGRTGFLVLSDDPLQRSQFDLYRRQAELGHGQQGDGVGAFDHEGEFDCKHGYDNEEWEIEQAKKKSLQEELERKMTKSGIPSTYDDIFLDNGSDPTSFDEASSTTADERPSVTSSILGAVKEPAVKTAQDGWTWPHSDVERVVKMTPAQEVEARAGGLRVGR
ncbi:uncharacterized protein KY384_005268 [Bacidia gigantensis]|uniref:uncharacterized protein n=1 Tax=Bacidia gigantensis TaxID=2732470 RepID=UPI001D04C956|nr:uncharacterized protein KY384_005268 [Bacidia gigantensis]KAG8529787.1 hypothetical protein KY384_005268 [Bacidia gigantensis]